GTRHRDSHWRAAANTRSLAPRASPKLIGRKIRRLTREATISVGQRGKWFDPSAKFVARMRSHEKGPAARQGQVYGVEAPRGGEANSSVGQGPQGSIERRCS